jgi:hypothetical protein
MSIKQLLFIIVTGLTASTLVSAAETTKSAQLAGKWPLNYCAKDMALDNEQKYIFLGDGERLTVLTQDLELISSTAITSSGQIDGIYYEAAKKYIYAACRNGGLKIMDVADVESPVEVGGYVHPNSSVAMVGVYVDNNRAYLACGIPGALMVDVSDPASPLLLKEIELPGAWVVYSYAVDAYAQGDFFWVADLLNGIRIINVEDIDKPALTNILLPNVRDLAVSGSYMYASVESNGYEIIDISDPKKPKETSKFLTSGHAEASQVDGNLAYIAYSFGSWGVRILDVTDKAKPVANKKWAFTENDANSLALFPEDTFLYITSDQAGMKKIDASDKTDMHSVASFDTPADAVAIDVSGSYVYAVDNTMGDAPEKEGLRILEISIPNPQSMLFTLSGFCATPGEASDVYVYAGYAYVADGMEGLQVIDVSDRKKPTIIGHADTSGFAAGVYVTENYAYVADKDQGLAIFDVKTPGSPANTAAIQTPGEALAVVVSGDYAYVADGTQGLAVIHVQDKTQPRIVGTLDLNGTAGGIYVDANYAYVAAGAQGLAVVSIAEKNSPALVSTVNTPGTARKVSVSGSYAYVADGDQGVCVINISDKTKPVKENDWTFGEKQGHSGIALDVFSGYSDANENLYALVADGAAGVVSVYLAVPVDDTDNDSGGGEGGGGGCFIRALFK